MQRSKRFGRPGRRVKELLPSQQLEVVRLIEAQGLAYRDFAWQQHPSTRTPQLLVPTIVHQPSGYACRFDQGPESPLTPRAITTWVQYSPGEHSLHEAKRGDTWEQQRQAVRIWLASLYRELRAIDEWNRLTQELARPDVLTCVSPPPNTGFTEAEKAHLLARLEALEQRLLASPAVTARQSELVQTELADLRAAVDRLGQRDWWKTALWVFNALKFVLEVVLPEEATASLQEFFHEGLRVLFGGADLPPLPPGTAT